MIIILFTPLQGGGHRFKSCTAHQGKSKPPAGAGGFFVLYIHNNLKNNKKREYSNVLPFCIHRGRPFAEQHRHMREWARDHARFRGRLGGGVSDQNDAMPSEMFGLARDLLLPDLAQFSPEGTGKDGFFHLADALQYVFGSFPGLLLPGKDAVQNADDLLLFNKRC